MIKIRNPSMSVTEHDWPMWNKVTEVNLTSLAKRNVFGFVV